MSVSKGVSCGPNARIFFRPVDIIYFFTWRYYFQIELSFFRLWYKSHTKLLHKCFGSFADRKLIPVITISILSTQDDVIKWKYFPRNWPFVRGIHRSPVNSPHKGQLRGALMFSLICVWINDWVNNREAGDLRRYRAHYGAIAMD